MCKQDSALGGKTINVLSVLLQLRFLGLRYVVVVFAIRLISKFAMFHFIFYWFRYKIRIE